MFERTHLSEYAVEARVLKQKRLSVGVKHTSLIY